MKKHNYVTPRVRSIYIINNDIITNSPVNDQTKEDTWDN